MEHCFQHLLLDLERRIPFFYGFLVLLGVVLIAIFWLYFTRLSRDLLLDFLDKNFYFGHKLSFLYASLPVQNNLDLHGFHFP